MVGLDKQHCPPEKRGGMNPGTREYFYIKSLSNLFT
jgi:hypothetical protein